MKKLRHRGWLHLSALAAAMLLIAAAPAAALSAGEVAAESPASTEPAVPPVEGAAPGTTAPPSTGWVPQGGATEGAGGGVAPTQHGSSLGSGGSPNHPRSVSEQPATEPVQPERSPSTTAPSGSYEPESSTPSTTVEGPVGTPETGGEVVPAESQDAVAPAAASAPPTVDAANAVAGRDPGQDADPGARLGVKGVSATSTPGPADPDSGTLPWPALVISFLVLAYAATRLLLGPVEPDLFRTSAVRRFLRAFPRV